MNICLSQDLQRRNRKRLKMPKGLSGNTEGLAEAGNPKFKMELIGKVIWCLPHSAWGPRYSCSETAVSADRELEMGRSKNTKRTKSPGTWRAGKDGTELTHQRSPRQNPNTFITVILSITTRVSLVAGSGRLGQRPRSWLMCWAQREAGGKLSGKPE